MKTKLIKSNAVLITIINALIVLFILKSSVSGATVSWDAGAGTDNSWDNANNWSADSVPGQGDDVFISENNRVVISRFVSINDLTMKPGSRLIVHGLAASFTAAGHIVCDGASFVSEDGAKIDLSHAETYRGRTDCNSDDFSATGIGSVLDFSGLTELIGTKCGQLRITASQGGQIVLSGITQMIEGGVRVSISDDSRVDLSGLINSTGFAFEIDGTGVLTAGNLTRLNSRVSLSGKAQLETPLVTNIDFSSFLVSGGSVWSLPPGVKSYRGHTDCNSDDFSATGVGSVLDFSALTELIGTKCGALRIMALQGGVIVIRESLLTADMRRSVDEFSKIVNPNDSPGGEPAQLRAERLTGVWISGTVGKKYRIERTATLEASDWTAQDIVELSESPQLWVDVDSSREALGYYRAVLQP
jgi:hypothetical protein